MLTISNARIDGLQGMVQTYPCSLMHGTCSNCFFKQLHNTCCSQENILPDAQAMRCRELRASAEINRKLDDIKRRSKTPKRTARRQNIR